MASNPPPGTIAAGYIRRSFASANSPGDASRSVQEAAVRALGGPNVVLYDADFGVSGNEANTHKRKDYLRLRADIEAGKVGSVSVYSLSRLGRSAKEVFDFADLCQKHGVILATSVEQIDTSTATGKMMFQMLSVLAEFESNLARERTLAALAAKRAKGQPHGEAPYGFEHRRDSKGNWTTVSTGEADAVVVAYKATGSMYATAKRLSADGVPTARGNATWTPSSVARVIQHAAPELLPVKPAGTKARRRKPTGSIFSRLIVCWCGRMMTPNDAKGGIFCSHGRTAAGHGLAWIGAKGRDNLIEQIKAEAATYAPPTAITATKDATTSDRKRLEAKRARLVDALADGLLGKTDAAQRIAEVDEELADNARREQSLESIGIPATGIDWSQPSEVIGDQLRQMFISIQMPKGYKGKPKFRWAVDDSWHDPAAKAAAEAEEEAAVAAFESEVRA